MQKEMEPECDHKEAKTIVTIKVNGKKKKVCSMCAWNHRMGLQINVL